MVQSKADRERQKLITDKCQSLIEVLLKDEDNKYCVDCDAKGPRWASWNLGVFLCIRCAGIHRNLGVHISKVKSVNLDAWTPEHVAYVQRMGNSRARAIYEANLPDDFRRPQTDTALESFIRAKYEHKKYIAQDYVDPGPPPPAFNIDDELKRIKEQKRSKATSNSSARMISVPDLPTPSPPNSKPRSTELIASATPTPPKSNPSALDLLVQLDLDSTPICQTIGEPSSTVAQQTPIQDANLSLTMKPEPLKPASSSILDLDLDFSAPPVTQTSQIVADNSTPKVLTKESILSLYSTDPFGMNRLDAEVQQESKQTF